MAWVGTYILGPDGEPVPADTVEWAIFFENVDQRRVAHTVVGRGEVSTVFTGLDPMGTLDTGAPQLWETAIFDVPGLEDTRRRHRSRLDALAYHEEAVTMARLAVQVSGAKTCE